VIDYSRPHPTYRKYVPVGYSQAMKRAHSIATEALATVFGIASLCIVMAAEYFASGFLLVTSAILGLIYLALLLLASYVPGQNTPQDRP
jgi:nicotinamide riboside transporter PnuC